MSTLTKYKLARLKEKGLRVSVARNGGIGFLIGGVLLVLRWNNARKTKKAWNKFKSSWIKYLMKYPLFLATFTLLYKTLIKIGRQLSGYRGLNSKTGDRLFLRKLAITISSFFCGYVAQIVSPVISWNWALYILLRSILSFWRLIIPFDLIPYPADIYSIIHGILPYLACYGVSYLPLSYRNFFKSSLDETYPPYHYMYEHKHGMLPNCKDTTHICDKTSCIKTHCKDFVYKFKICYLFYIKFYFLTNIIMYKPIKYIKLLIDVNDPKHIKKLLNQSLRSCLFLLISFHFPSRIHCLYRWYLLKYHRLFKNNQYTIIAANQINIMLVLSAIFGTLCLRFEKSISKRSDIALFSVWRLIEQYIRKYYDLKTFDNDKYHPVLGNKQLPALLFGIACSILVYVHLTDASKLKSLERSILNFFLV